jgi:uncharacterized protein YbjT (DUF2867 family)
MKIGDKKAIVIGATGLVGEALIDELQQSKILVQLLLLYVKSLKH